jgi:hypothetical protein
MIRSELGLVFLFIFLVALKESKNRRGWKMFALLSLTMTMVALSHQLVSVLMFVVFAVYLWQWLSRKEYSGMWSLVLGAVPAVIVFCLTLYADLVWSPAQMPGGWYSLFGFSSLSESAISAVGFLLFCYLPILPLVIIGFKHFQSVELKAWVFGCLLAAIGSVVFPYSFVPQSYRWTLLLVFPMAFFAVEGFALIPKLWRRVSGALLVLLSFSFVLLPAQMAFPYFGAFTYYSPSSMLQNSVPASDCGDVQKALVWVRGNLRSGDALLVHDAFNGWALLVPGEAKIVCYGYDDPETAAIEKTSNYSRLFLLWWVNGSGWHGLSALPSSFEEVFHSGMIAVYEYTES